MTDARLPGKWVMDPVMDGLSDRAWRTFTGALMWSNEAGTDGRIPQTALRFLHPLGVDNDTLTELVEAGLLEPGDRGTVVVLNWVGMGQELAEVVQLKKEQARNRQRKSRLKKRSEVTGDSNSDVTRDVGHDIGQDRTGHGQDTTGPDAGRVSEWPTVQPGEGGRKAS